MEEKLKKSNSHIYLCLQYHMHLVNAKIHVGLHLRYVLTPFGF